MMKRRGFSLAEIMVMIIVAGSCMTPIIGMMDSMMTRGKTYELRRSMQNAVESKMNDLIYRGFVDGVTPTAGVTYLNYPNDTNPEASFTIRVEVISQFTTSSNPGLAAPVTGAQDPKLKGVSVEATVNPPGPDVGKVSVFTMFDKPRQLIDMLYLACPTDRKIYEIHPLSHAEIDSFQLDTTFVPYQIAVHPNGEWLAIKAVTAAGSTPGKVLMMDIRRGSSKRGKANAVTNSVANLFGATTAANNEPSNGLDGYRASGGLAFRSDGKVLYYTYWTGTEYRIKAATVGTLPSPGNLTSGIWAETDIDPGNITTVMDLEMGQDGYLYLVTAGNTTQPIVRINTTNNAVEVLNPTWTNFTADNVRAVAPSWDGNEVAIWMDGEGAADGGLGFIQSAASTMSKDFQVLDSTHFVMSLPAGTNDLLVARDNRWLIFPIHHANSGSSKDRMGLIRRSVEGTWETPDFDLANAANRKAFPESYDAMYQLRHSPNGREIIADTFNTSKISFFKISDLLAGTFVPTDFTPSGGGKIADIAGRIPEILWIGVANQSAPVGKQYYLINFDLEGGGTRGRYTEETMIPVTATPTAIALNGAGDIACVTLSGEKFVNQLNTLTNNFSTPSNWPDFRAGTGDGSLCDPKKAAWLLDNSLVILASKTADAGNTGITNTANNGFRLYQSDANGDINDVSVLGANFKGTDGWLVKDVAAMHTRNGAYVLMGKAATTYTTESALVWIEKSKSRGMTGTEGTLEYKIMNIWFSKYDNFPTRCPFNMALSYDDSILAFYCPIGNGTNGAVVTWDMRNLHYPAQPGLVMTAYQGTSSNFTEAPAPMTLKQALTSLLPTGSTFRHPKYPAAYVNDNNTPVSVQTMYQRTGHFFGYWYPYQVSGFVGNSEQLFRPFIDGVGLGLSTYDNDGTANKDPWFDVGTLPTHEWNITLSDASHTLQMDTMGPIMAIAHNQGFGKITGGTGATGNPAGSTQVFPAPPLFGGTTGGGGIYGALEDTEVRAFRFRPQLLADIILDGNWRSAGDVPTVGARTDATVRSDSDQEDAITFHRDRDRAILYYMYDTAEYVYGINLFDNGGNYSSLDLGPVIGSSADPEEMVVSPDGRRLIINVPKETAGYGLVLADINATTFSGAQKMSLPSGYKPSAFGIRPFNSFKSGQSPYLDQGVGVAVLCGNQRAVMSDKGITLVGGAGGVDQAPVTTVQKYDPTQYGAVTISALTALSGALKHVAAANFDSSVFAFGGENSVPNALASVTPLSGGTYDQLRNNDNTPYVISNAAACTTPYGTVIVGGKSNTAVTNLVTTTDFTVSPTLVTGGNNCTVGTYLELAGPGSGMTGSAYLPTPVVMGPTTSFKTYFKATLYEKDGLTFVVHNDPRGTGAIAQNNAQKCYFGTGLITQSLGALIYTAGGGPGGIAAANHMTIHKNGLSAAVAAGGDWDMSADGINMSGVTTLYIWIEYDGGTHALTVFYNTSNNRGTAVQKINMNIGAALTSAGFLNGNQAYFGFVGANNNSPGYIRVNEWTLDVFDGPANTVKVHYPHCISPVTTTTPPTGLVAHWKFDGALAATEADASGNGNTLNLAGAPTSVAGPTGFGNAMHITSNAQYGSRNRLVQDDFTLACWIKTSTAGPDSTYWHGRGVITSPVSGYTDDWGFYLSDGGKVQAMVGCGSDNDHYSPEGTTTVTDNVWRHVAMTRQKSTGTVKAYVNGVQDLTFTTGEATTLDAESGMYIGRNDEYTSSPFIGDMDDVQIYNRVLSGTEIQSIMDPVTFKNGETLALANLPEAAQNGAAVTHYSRKDREWYLFYVGGRDTSGNTPTTNLIYKYDFDAGTWDSGAITGQGVTVQKFGVAACSWGDEIFIFGGVDNTGTVQSSVMAYNPDTGKTRTCSPLASAYCFQSAIPLGPYIYLLGGATGVSGANAVGKVLRFKP